MVAMNGAKRGDHAGHGELMSRVTDGAAEMIDYAKTKARSAAREVKRNVRDVTRALAETAQDEAERLYKRHKGRAVSKVNSLGKIAKQTAHALHAVKADA